MLCAAYAVWRACALVPLRAVVLFLRPNRFRSLSDEPAYIRNLRALTRADPTFEHLEALEKELYASASARATAVMFGSFVEVALERLLASKMRPLNSKDRKQVFEYEGAVGTFASKTVIAYAMKFIGPVTRADLDLIRFLRNEFAHSRIPFDFQTPEVAEVCKHLQFPELPGSLIPHGYLSRVADDELATATDRTAPKTRFILACHSLSYRMILETHGPREGDMALPEPILP